MNKVFVRALWGKYTREDRILGRRFKVDDDIKLCLLNKFTNPFYVYVFGEDNYKYLTDMGFKCFLVSKQPVLYQKAIGSHYYSHKLFVWKEAMKDFDEIVFTDWDCIETRPKPENFWEELAKKEPIQATLHSYRKVKCPWRKTDRTKRPGATFVYIRDKTIPMKLINIWKRSPENKLLSEEQIMAIYTDEFVGGWQGRLKYWELYEPKFHYTQANNYPPELIKTKTTYYVHCNKHFVRGVLGRVAGIPNVNEKKNKVAQLLLDKCHGLENYIKSL